MSQEIKKPEAGKALTTVAAAGVKTPMLKLKYSSLANPYYYPNANPPIPRYSVTCVIDPNIHQEFIKKIQALEKSENAPQTVLKEESRQDKETGDFITTGNYIIKFQTKNKIPLIVVRNKVQENPIHPEEEIPYNSDVVVVFDVIRYSNRATGEKCLSFQPKTIFYYGTHIENEPQPTRQEENEF